MVNKDLLALLKSTPYYNIRIELLSARKNNLKGCSINSFSISD
jgi:hypothetical protein